MTGPERLEVGQPLLRRRTGWLVVVVAVAVVGGLTVLRTGGAGGAPEPSSSPSPAARLPASAPAPAPRGWPTGLGLAPGTLFVLADDGLHTVDVSGGLVERVAVDVAPEGTGLTPLSYGVLVWPRAGGRTLLLAHAGDGGLQPVGPLRSVDTVLPGPDGSVWVGSPDPRHPDATTTWVQADEEGDPGPAGPRAGDRGRRRGRRSLRRRRRSVRHVTPGAPYDVGPGAVLAVGTDGYLVNRGADGTCTAVLHERAGGRVLPVRAAAPPHPQRPVTRTDPAALSPGLGLLAETLTTDVGDQVRVSRVGATPAVLRTIPGGTRGTALVWLSARWLLASSGDGLALYDAEDDTLLEPVLPLHGASQVVLVPA